MARIRTIKPEFPQSESMGRVSRDARLLFLMLFTIVDDAGRTRAASRMLASLLYPYDDDAKDHMDLWLDQLQRQGAIRLYDVDGNTYLQIEKWLEHQKIDRASPSRLPAPPPKPRVTLAKPREGAATDLVSSTLDLGPGIKDQSKSSPQAASVPRKRIAKSEPDGFQEFYTAFPLHKARPAAAKAYARAITRATPQVILDGAIRYAKQRATEDHNFTKHPATWLNNDCWLDQETPHVHNQKPANRSFGSAVSHVARKRAGEGLFSDGDAIAGQLTHQQPEGGGGSENLQLGHRSAAE